MRAEREAHESAKKYGKPLNGNYVTDQAELSFIAEALKDISMPDPYANLIGLGSGPAKLRRPFSSQSERMLSESLKLL